MTKAENTSGWVKEPTLARMERCFTKLALKVKSNSQRIPASVNGWKERLALEHHSIIDNTEVFIKSSFMEWNDRKPLMHLVTKLPDGMGYPKEQLGPRHFLFFHNVRWHCISINKQAKPALEPRKGANCWNIILCMPSTSHTGYLFQSSVVFWQGQNITSRPIWFHFF